MQNQICVYSSDKSLFSKHTDSDCKDIMSRDATFLDNTNIATKYTTEFFFAIRYTREVCDVNNRRNGRKLWRIVQFQQILGLLKAKKKKFPVQCGPDVDQ